MKSFNLTIVTPDGVKFSGDAVSVLVRTQGGDVQILAYHTDYLAALGIGRAKIALPDGEERIASASGGFISVTDGNVSIACTTFEFSEEIDVKRAEAARENAERAISLAKSESELLCAKAKLARALARLSATK